jgi:hypothetical protein
LPRPAQSSGQHGGAQHQQDVPDDGPGYRGLHDIVEPCSQRCDSDDEFGGIPERRIDKASNSFAHALGKPLGGLAIHPARGRMAREEVAKIRRCRSGRRIFRPMAMGMKGRSQFIAMA